MGICSPSKTRYADEYIVRTLIRYAIPGAGAEQIVSIGKV
jgi:hypothetical protein